MGNFLHSVAIILSQDMYKRRIRSVSGMPVSCMGGGDINDKNVLLNITVDVKVVLFSLTHAVLIVT